MKVPRPAADVSTVAQHGRSHWTAILIAAAVLGFAISAIAVWPGILSYDTQMQYEQVLMNRYGDWHPPAMAVLWRQLLPIASGGAPMLVFHLSLYWAGLALLAATMNRDGPPLLCIAMLAIGLLPHLLLPTLFIHKDVGLAACLITSLAIIFWFRSRGSALPWYATTAALMLLAYGALVRSNGPFAVTPLAAYLIAPAFFSKPMRLLLIGGVVTVVGIAGAKMVNRHVFHAADDHAQRSLVLFDVIGIAARASDPSVFQRKVNPTQALIDRCYSAAAWDPLYAKPECKAGIDNEWVHGNTLVKAIRRHPIAYLEHRIAHANEEMFLWTPISHWHWPDYKRFNLPRANNEPAVKQALDWASNFPLFSPAVSMIVCTVLLGATIAYGQQSLGYRTQAAYYLLTATLFYTGSFLLIGVANMYRYHQFALSATLIALIIYIAGARERPATQNTAVRTAALVTAAITLAIASTARILLPVAAQ